MTHTLTTERLREIASSPSFSANPLTHEVKYMARELLANREAQPVAWSTLFGDKRAVTVHSETAEVWNNDGLQVQSLFTAPPAPAVPDSRDAFESTWADVMSGNKPARSAVEGQDYAGGAAEFAWKWWQRAAMLDQPVRQGYKLPDNVREALTLALQAMEFMGDTLNNIDAVCTEDVEYVTPAFAAVRGLLAAAPEGGNG